MQPTCYPVEGDFIVADNGMIFEIKDFHQPKDRVVGFLRYAPVMASEGRTRTGMKYKKIYDLPARFDYIKQKALQWFFSPPNYYFPLQAVPFNNITEHVRPELGLANIQNNKDEDLSPVAQDCVAFCQYLAKNAQVPLKYLGITGSTLLGLDTESSDIDIIVYGFGNSLKVREVLRGDFARSNDKEVASGADSRPRRYTHEEFKVLYKVRTAGVPEPSISFYNFLKYEVRKLHQGKFKNRDFFIRFLEYPSREQYSQQNHFEQREICSLGRITITGEIRGDEFWWTTPARVQPANIFVQNASNLSANASSILDRYSLRLQDIVQTFTLRGRYIENVRLLESFRAQGTLELVIEPQCSPFLQIAFGSDPRDYLMVC